MPVEVPRKPKTGGKCDLNSILGKTPIGSPSTLNMKLEQIENEDNVSIEAEQFLDIESLRDEPLGYATF